MKYIFKRILKPVVVIIIVSVVLSLQANPVTITVSNPEEFKQALHKLSGKKGRILLKKGKYSFKEVFKIEKCKNISIAGEGGPGETVFDFKVSGSGSIMKSKYLFYFYSCSDIELENVTCNFASGGRYSAAFGIYSCRGVMVRNCSFNNKGARIASAVTLLNAKKITIDGIHINGFQSYAFYLSRSQDVTIMKSSASGTKTPLKDIKTRDLVLKENNFGDSVATSFDDIIQEAAELEKQHEVDKAFKKLKWLILNYPKNRDAWLHYSKAAVRLNLHEDARKGFDTYVKLGGEEYLAWYYKGLTFLDNEDFESSIAWFKKSIKLKSDFLPARKGLEIAEDSVKKNPHFILYTASGSGSLKENGRAYGFGDAYIRGYRYRNITSESHLNAPSKLRVELFFKNHKDSLVIFLRRTPEGWISTGSERWNQPVDIAYSYGDVKNGEESIGRIQNIKGEFAEPDYRVTVSAGTDANIIKKLRVNIKHVSKNEVSGVESVTLNLNLKESGYLFKSVYTRKNLEDIRNMDFSERVTGVPSSIMQKLYKDYHRHIPELVAYLVKGIDDDVVKAKIIHDWIAHNFHWNGLDAFNYQKSIKSGDAFCHNYVNFFTYMCRFAGIDAAHVQDMGGRHGFNGLMINNKWYFIDVGYDDKKSKVITKYLFRPFDEFFMKKGKRSKYDVHLPSWKELWITDTKPAMVELREKGGF